MSLNNEAFYSRSWWRLASIMALCLLALIGCSSNWKLKETKSEMDDSVRYSVITESAREVKFNKGDPYHPFLSVAVEKGETSIRSNPGEMIHFTERGRLRGTSVGLGTVKIRFDEEAPFSVEIMELPNSREMTACMGPEGELLTKMLKHKTMKIQWATVAGTAPIDTFKLEGLQDALLKVCANAPDACKPNYIIGGALASVGVQVGGGRASGSARPEEPATPPAAPMPTAAANKPVVNALKLPAGTYVAATPEWISTRDQVIRWCNVNPGKCSPESIAALTKPADGSLVTPYPPGGNGALLTTCSPASCMSGMLTSAEFIRDGQSWKITKVATEPTGD